MDKYSNELRPNTVLRQTADRYRQLRKRSGYTQQELAERSGVSLGSLKRFEQTGQVAFAFLLRLAHVLDTLSDFSPEPLTNERSQQELTAIFDRIEQEDERKFSGSSDVV